MPQRITLYLPKKASASHPPIGSNKPIDIAASDCKGNFSLMGLRDIFLSVHEVVVHWTAQETPNQYQKSSFVFKPFGFESWSTTALVVVLFSY